MVIKKAKNCRKSEKKLEEEEQRTALLLSNQSLSKKLKGTIVKNGGVICMPAPEQHKAQVFELLQSEEFATLDLSTEYLGWSIAIFARSNFDTKVVCEVLKKNKTSSIVLPQIIRDIDLSCFQGVSEVHGANIDYGKCLMQVCYDGDEHRLIFEEIFNKHATQQMITNVVTRMTVDCEQKIRKIVMKKEEKEYVDYECDEISRELLHELKILQRALDHEKKQNGKLWRRKYSQ